MISRNLMAEELILRENLNKAIKLVKQKVLTKGLSKINEEIEVRKVLQDLILEAATEDPEKSPHNSTGINVLETLLKNIIKTVEDDFKQLTTASEQRDSYRAHLLNAVKNTLAPVNANMDAIATPETGELDEVELNVDRDEDKFIDVRPSKEKEPEADPRADFSAGVSGFEDDHTGRDGAYETFQKVENQIVDSYSKLGNEQDQETFYDYLITNLKLYLDKFEDELSAGGSLEEPTTPEYEQEKDAMAQEPAPMEPDIDSVEPEAPIV